MIHTVMVLLTIKDQGIQVVMMATRVIIVHFSMELGVFIHTFKAGILLLVI
jgi:hypothetical protein